MCVCSSKKITFSRDSKCLLQQCLAIFCRKKRNSNLVGPFRSRSRESFCHQKSKNLTFDSTSIRYLHRFQDFKQSVPKGCASKQQVNLQNTIKSITSHKKHRNKSNIIRVSRPNLRFLPLREDSFCLKCRFASKCPVPTPKKSRHQNTWVPDLLFGPTPFSPSSVPKLLDTKQPPNLANWSWQVSSVEFSPPVPIGAMFVQPPKVQHLQCLKPNISSPEVSLFGKFRRRKKTQKKKTVTNSIGFTIEKEHFAQKYVSC